MSNPHQHIYTRRMNQVLDHIDLHLDQKLELAELAAEAHFSPYHFHHLFQAWMGETLGNYLRRRRLEVVAMRLAYHPQSSILELALEVGFGSGEAMSRAFKTRFGMTPSQWRQATPERWGAELAALRQWQTLPSTHGGQTLRQDSNLDQELLPTPLDDIDLSSFSSEHLMQVRITTLAPTRIAYMRHIGPYGPTIHQLWHQTFLPWRTAQGLEQAPCYGIGHDDPHVTPPDQCRYDAAVAVAADYVAAPPVNTQELPGGLYAMAHFHGQPQEFSLAWAELLRDWLPASGYQLDQRPLFEYYDHTSSYDAKTNVIDCSLCIPLRPL